MGALLVVRRPDNAVGACLVLAGIGYSISMATGVVAFTSLAVGGSDDLALAAHAGWWTVAFSSLGGFALFYLAFIFPTGRGHSPRWEALRAECLGRGVQGRPRSSHPEP